MSATPQVDDDASTETPVEPLAECATARDIEALDGDVIERELIEDGDRIRRTRWEVISEPSELVNIETGDILIRLCAGRPAVITDIGDDVSGGHGMHIQEDIIGSDDDAPPTHLRLVRNAIEDNQAIIAGTRTSKAANVEEVGQ